MNELTKAQQTANLLASDCLAALKAASDQHRRRPEGSTLGDRAICAWLSECSEMARKLESKLLAL